MEQVSSQGRASDKRYLPRWEVSNRIICQLEDDGQKFETSSRDLSCTGACLSAPQGLPLNKKIKLKIYLKDDLSVKVEGHILWNRSAGGDHLIGVNFSNISQTAQDLILKHAFEIKKGDLVNHWFQGWDQQQPSA